MKKFLAILLVIAFITPLSVNAAEPPILMDTPAKEEINKPVITEQVNAVQPQTYKEVSPLALVDAPHKYLNKQIKIKGVFDKYTALGLDYPPIKRDAKTYISFLIKRENVTAYNIPLSELKLIAKRDYAEKEMLNIEQGDEIEIYGNVFSTAIGDPWVSVDKVVCLTVHKDKEKKETDKK